MLRKGGSLLTNVAPEGRQWLNRMCLCAYVPVCFYMERGNYGQDCASFTLIKDAT